MSLLLYPGIRPGKRIAFASAYCTINVIIFLTFSITRACIGVRPVLPCAWNKTFSDVMGFDQLKFSSQPMKENKCISANMATMTVVYLVFSMTVKAITSLITAKLSSFQVRAKASARIVA